MYQNFCNIKGIVDKFKIMEYTEFMGRGPEFGRRIAKALLIGGAVAGGAAAMGAKVDYNTYTGPQRQEIIDSSTSNASKIIREKGLDERTKTDQLVLLGGTLLFILTAGTLVTSPSIRNGSAGKNNPVPQT